MNRPMQHSMNHNAANAAGLFVSGGQYWFYFWFNQG